MLNQAERAFDRSRPLPSRPGNSPQKRIDQFDPNFAQKNAVGPRIDSECDGKHAESRKRRRLMRLAQNQEALA